MTSCHTIVIGKIKMLKLTCKGKDLVYQLDRSVDEGWLTRSRHKTLPLAIYCYSNSTQYEGHWTDITKFARGVVVDNEGQVIALPFQKFFNWGEKNAPFPPKYKDYLAFEKLDGSLLNFWQYNGVWNASTKGSFDNEYIDFGMKYASDNACIGMDLSTDLTLMTEVVMPADQDGMRRAVVHDPGVYFLGATQTETRKDLNPTMFYGLWNGKFPELYKNSIDELLQNSNVEEGTEGWVIRYSNGMRFKIKTVWYLRLFRLISKLDSTVKEQMLAGQGLERILVDVPEELEQEITELFNDIMFKVYTYKIMLRQRYVDLTSGKSLTRKAFAQAISKDSFRPYLFKLFDERDIHLMLLKAVIDGELE